jgi:hypothetical protein
MTPVNVSNIALAEAQSRTSINGFPPIDNTPAAVQAGQFFRPKVQALLRAANWDFARKQILLTLLKSALVNGQPSSDPPPQPWAYSYAYPNDCLRLRFLIQYQQPSPAGIPFTTGPQNVINPAYAVTSVPFVVANDPQASGAPRKVILTNMQNAYGVYTCDLSQVPDMWDPLFLSGVTATLAAYFIASLSGDRALMATQIQAAKGVLDQARGMNGNESISNQDRIPDWIQVRASGAWNMGWCYGNGMAVPTSAAYDSMGFPGGLFY